MEDATLIHTVGTRYVLRSVRHGHDYPLTDAMLVGREADCSLTLPEQHVSRYHAKILVSPQGVWVEDLQSSNGTFINGQRISGRQRLELGDEIAFHEARFRLATADSGDAEATILETPDGLRRVTPLPDSTPTATHTNPTKDPDAEGTRMLSTAELNKLAQRQNNPPKTVLDNGCGPRLVIMTAPLRGKVIPLNQPLPDSHWRIGRAASADIQLEDRTVSQDHARLGKTAGGWFISTTHARNGLHVNGVATQRAFVKHNDRIRFGRLEVCLKLESTTSHEPLPVDQPTSLMDSPWRLTAMLVALTALAVGIVTAAIVL